MTLGHVLWLGGPPGSGKTTIAKRMSRRHGLRWYNADAHTWSHRDRAIAAGHAAARRWETMTPDERWLTATPTELLELSLHRERGPLIVDDLRALPASPLIVAEGSPVPPDVVSTGIADRAQAVWLIPTAAFRRARLDERGGSDAARRRMDELHLLMAEAIERDAREHGAPILEVDASRGVDEMVAVAENLFAEALAAGPRAETVADRRALLRFANDAIVSQCLAYLARPWSNGDPESFVRAFVCECDDVECDEVVELAVAAFVRAAATGPVLADAHG